MRPPPRRGTLFLTAVPVCSASSLESSWTGAELPRAPCKSSRDSLVYPSLSLFHPGMPEFSQPAPLLSARSFACWHDPLSLSLSFSQRAHWQLRLTGSCLVELSRFPNGNRHRNEIGKVLTKELVIMMPLLLGRSTQDNLGERLFAVCGFRDGEFLSQPIFLLLGHRKEEKNTRGMCTMSANIERRKFIFRYFSCRKIT